MSLFNKSENTQAFLKAGLMGFAGSGKTYTASEIAIGLVKLMRSRNLPSGNNPVMFIDTETGSDWVKPRFALEKIDLHTAKTRAFTDLLTAVREAEAAGGVLIIDSITHFWREICDSYAEKRDRKRGLEFQDWAVLKKQWARYTDLFINSNCHIIMCGRAGYEYDFFENANGKKELEKTGIKMRAEGETGFEPSLLVLMERHTDMDTKKAHRVATVLKDRSTLLDGKEFTNPKFKDFLPHIDMLNLGGHQLGVDTTRDSKELFDHEGKPHWQRDNEEKVIVLDEILEVIKKHHSGQNDAAKKARGDLMEKHLGTRSWERIQTLKLDVLKSSRNTLWLELEGVPFGFVPPVDKQAEAENDAMDAAQDAAIAKVAGGN